MKITKIQLENFRGFVGKHEIELPEGNCVAIIGVNGAGKTSILDAIACPLQNISSHIAYSSYKPKSLTKRNKDSDISKLKSKTNTTIFFENEQQISVGLGIKQTYFCNSHSLINFLNSKFSRTGQLPLLVYYQTNRNLKESDIKDYTTVSSTKAERRQAHVNAFDPQIDYPAILTWYLQQVNIQNNEKVKRKDFDFELPTISAISAALNTFFANLDDAYLENAKIEVGQIDGQQVLLLEKEDSAFELEQLSAGEKMVIGMVLDIAYRMSIANPNEKNPLKTEGIVLIDELELHLHPKWQMSILNAFSKTFPNIQFIVTTHSPLVINQLRNEQILVLDNFKIISGKKLHNTYGRDVNSIIEDFMGGLERPRAVKNAIHEIEKLLDAEKPNTKLAREKLEVLQAKVDPNDYELVKLATLISMEEDEVD